VQKMSFICHSLLFLASVWAARGLSKLLAANGDMSSKQPTASELVGNKNIIHDLNICNDESICTCAISHEILTLFGV